MRRNGGLWMVTLADREPDLYEELPMYFRTRRAARGYAAEQEKLRDFGEFGWGDETLAVKAAPDDIRAADIAWDDDDG